jgi:hypothetical protein
MGLSPLSQIASLGASAGNFLSYPAASLGLKDKDGNPLKGSLGNYLGGLFTSSSGSGEQTSTGTPESGTGATAPTYPGQGPGTGEVPYTVENPSSGEDVSFDPDFLED